MQAFTRFYRNLVYCELISDFSTSLQFLFNEDDFTISNLISVISARVYEILLGVGPLRDSTCQEHSCQYQLDYPSALIVTLLGLYYYAH